MVIVINNGRLDIGVFPTPVFFQPFTGSRTEGYAVFFEVFPHVWKDRQELMSGRRQIK